MHQQVIMENRSSHLSDSNSKAHRFAYGEHMSSTRSPNNLEPSQLNLDSGHHQLYLLQQLSFHQIPGHVSTKDALTSTEMLPNDKSGMAIIANPSRNTQLEREQSSKDGVDGRVGS